MAKKTARRSASTTPAGRTSAGRTSPTRPARASSRRGTAAARPGRPTSGGPSAGTKAGGGSRARAGAAGKSGAKSSARSGAKNRGKTASQAGRQGGKTAATTRARKATAGTRRARTVDPLLATVRGAEHRYVGHVRLDVAQVGAARVKRMIYPPGFRWSVDMRPAVGTALCMHAHAGFLVKGRIHIEYADGCVVEHQAPQIIAIDPGHDGWVVGDEPVVMIEFDFGRDTVRKLGMPKAHTHR